MMHLKNIGWTCLLGAALLACNEPFVPKPVGYFDVPLPEKTYRSFDTVGYPYAFEYPVYARVIKDTTYFETTPENPWWINIDFPNFQARIHISYKELAKNNYEKLVEDAFKLTYKHSYKASGISDSFMLNPQGVPGIFFRVKGNAATANQFFLTDSSRHFLRGALYFDTTPNEDSLAPMDAFLKADLLHLIQSFRWKDPSSTRSNRPTLTGNQNF